MMKNTAGVAVASAILLLSATVPSVAGTAPSQQVAPAPGWGRVHTTWPKRSAVALTDVTTIGSGAWIVGNTVSHKTTAPWVQRCVGHRCRRSHLPQQAAPARVLSVGASSRRDIWAVGYHIDKANHTNVPTWWHSKGAKWTVTQTPIHGDIVLANLAVANASKAFVVGRYNYIDGFTSTLYRWNGVGWKELSPLGDSDFPSPCGWYHRRWVDVVARPGDAVLVGTCGVKSKPMVLEQGNATWDEVRGTNFPDGVVWSEGAFIGQQLWLTGTHRKHRVIYARDGSAWGRISTVGIPARAVITDLAGVQSNKVWAVGWIPTAHKHSIAASWRWSAGRWHPTDVPAGVSRSKLQAVSVRGEGIAWTVGTDAAQPPTKRGLVLHEN